MNIKVMKTKPQPILHMILTRYAVKIWDDKVLNKDFVEARRPILESFAMQSLLQQRNKNFIWVVFIDSNFYDQESEWIMKELDGKFPVLCIKVTGSFAIQPAQWLDQVQSKLSIDSERVYLSTRLDSDDAIAPTYVEKVQKLSAKHTGKFLIDFSLGLYADLSNSQFRLHRYRSSQTLTYVEYCKPQEFESVYKGHHGYMLWNEKHYRTWNFSPQWLITIHGSNAFNKLEGMRLLFFIPKWAQKLVKDFNSRQR
jgi:hypothetical protein